MAQLAANGKRAGDVAYRIADPLQVAERTRRIAPLSLAASEHSIITVRGKEHILDAYRNLLQANPSGLVA